VNTIQAIIIAIVEGITEYLPVSSTAHMIFASSLMGIEKEEFVKMFQVSIQFGAILSVIVAYRTTFFNTNNLKFYVKLSFAVLPALVLGYLFDDKIEAVLEKPVPIAVTMICGGIFLLFIDKIFDNKSSIEQQESISIPKAVTIGFWQCLAMMPGVSRSAASIIGGMQQKLSRRLAAEFSFFLAVPTMCAVTLYSVFLKDWKLPEGEQKGYEMILADNAHISMFILGNVVAFFVALLAIKSFVGILNKYGFKPFGWYRILAGILILFLLR
jgi:undecaprenyl-diphosphatase